MAPRKSGTRPQEQAVGDLLEWVALGELALPEFQRDYDWENKRAIALVATMIKGWPAGSLLLQEVDGQTFFRLRPFEGGPEIDPKNVALVVLDGQQRLTALYQALYDAGSSVYAIQASALSPDATVDELEEAMRSFDREEWDREYRECSFFEGNEWIPLYALRSATDYFSWRDEVGDRSGEPERIKLLISDAYRNGLERFHKYRFPAVLVESGLEPAAIARIFERVNRQGLVLKTFDLMVARTFAKDWNLRDQWAEACFEYPQLDDFFKDDGMPVIRAIALATVGNMREQAVLNLEPGSVRMQWEDAVQSMARTVAFLVAECGVVDSTWTPYGSMVVTLAATERSRHIEERGDVILKWFLSRSLGLRYETAANTVAVEEYRHLLAVLEGVQDLSPVPLSGRMIRGATRKRQGAAWRSFMCCLAMAGATGIGFGHSDRAAKTAIPLLEKASAPAGLEPPHQLVLNLGLADQAEARELTFAGVARVAEYLSGLSATRRKQVERAQFLPDIDGSESVDDFVTGRLERLNRWLTRALGYGFDGV